MIITFFFFLFVGTRVNGMEREMMSLEGRERRDTPITLDDGERGKRSIGIEYRQMFPIFFYSAFFFLFFFFLFFLIGSLKRAPLFRKKIPETDRCASTVCYVLRMALVTAGEPFLGQGYLALSPFLSRSLRPSVCPSRSLYQR